MKLLWRRVFGVYYSYDAAITIVVMLRGYLRGQQQQQRRRNSPILAKTLDSSADKRV